MRAARERDGRRRLLPLLIRGQYGHRMRLTGFGQKVLAAARLLAGLLGDLQRGAEER
ncbi:hypothetical protein OG894_01185 [Streptomyces sp. NBC_01724]|uniref:hypothetical protein n=1 Tax=Streptomyces sp. NBC_01724 TaxID=2975922 RepID=UPI002E32E2A1|nr:hypothetical protein [Streptomyces sp. NBC_01724]